MTAAVVVNEVRRGFYLDSVALMRVSRRLEEMPGIAAASLMIGTGTNKQILRAARLLAAEGETAGPNDLVLALRSDTRASIDAALSAAASALTELRPAADGRHRPRSLGAAADGLAGANLALVSVPGAFAAAEARKALARGLHVLLFSDNVSEADEAALKRLAAERGLLLMGPDCGTAYIAGTPLAFANEVPRGDIGVVAASGTGLQEVACLLARAGRGLSHGIGVGGRDLSPAIGGLGTLAALDVLDRDPATRHIVLVSKPPSPEAARRVFERVAGSVKPVTVCWLGASGLRAPANARMVTTLKAAAESAIGAPLRSDSPKIGVAGKRSWIRGLFAGGTLCAEAQIVLMQAGLAVSSNVPVPGASARAGTAVPGHALLDLGADEFTIGRPHPMIDPQVRDAPLREALRDPDVAVVLLDVVLGHGAHDNPAGAIAALGPLPPDGPAVVASVTGTDADPQGYTRQVAILRAANVAVAGSNADAAALAAGAVRAAS